MSVRATNYPLTLPTGVEVTLSEKVITIKGTKGSLSLDIHPNIEIKKTDHALNFSAKEKQENMHHLGTAYALVRNMVKGVSDGFERKLELVGVGYKAQLKGDVLELGLGYSHPIDFKIPTGVTVKVDKQTSLTIEGIDKQLVGQVAANIREFRPVEPYKGKGVRYADEVVIKKEVKKK